MKILLSPQVRTEDKIWYEIEHQKIKIKIDGVEDIFDFNDLPDGEIQTQGELGDKKIETSLKEIPIINARKEKGVLYVELIFSIEEDEKDDRLLFPKEMSLSEFNNLMFEISNKKRSESKTEEAQPSGDGSLSPNTLESLKNALRAGVS